MKLHFAPCRVVSGAYQYNQHTNLGLAMVEKGSSMFIIEQWSMCG